MTEIMPEIDENGLGFENGLQKMALYENVTG